MQHRNHSAIEPQKTIHKQHSKITTRAEDSGMGSHSGKAKLKPKKVEFAIKKNCKNWQILRFPPYTRRGDCRVFRLPLNLQRHYCKFSHPASLCRAIQFIPFFYSLEKQTLKSFKSCYTLFQYWPCEDGLLGCFTYF